MKKIAFTLALAALFTIGAGLAGARPTTQPKLSPVTVVMHDPGCHWFAVRGRFLKTLAVNGPAKLTNFDEATLRVRGPNGMMLARIGKPVVLAKGLYKITMVGQAPDDNHLALLVK